MRDYLVEVWGKPARISQEAQADRIDLEKSGVCFARHPPLVLIIKCGAAAVTPSTAFEISGGSQKLAVDRLAGLLMGSRRNNCVV